MSNNREKPRITSGTPINIARVRKGYTQAQLAKEIGVTTLTLKNWELGLFQPPIKHLRKIAEILDVGITDLLETSENTGLKYQIAKIRRAKKMPQYELAETIGKSRIQVSNYETGVSNPSPEVLSQIASALNVSVDDLKGSKEVVPRYDIRGARMKKGLSQVQFAEALGVVQSTVSLYEKHIRTPSDEMLAKIADILDTTVEDMIIKQEDDGDD